MTVHDNFIKPLSNPRLVNDHIPAAAIVASYNEHFTILEANEAYYKLVGYSKEEIWDLFKNCGLATLHEDDMRTALFSLQHQIDTAPTKIFNIVARIVNKTQGYKSIHLSGYYFPATATEEASLFILLVDITSQIKLFEGLEKEKRFNQLIDTLTDDSFFEYTVATKEIRFSKHFAEKFQVNELTLDFPESLIASGLIEQNFIDTLQVDNTVDIIPSETVITAPDGTEYSYNVFYKIEKNINNIPVRVIGKLNDVTAQRIQIGQLKAKAERDHLTGLYNKAATEALIDQALTTNRDPDNSFALMIVDVDNFKSVNDILGHLFGDIVLAQLAQHLKTLFRSNDIIGRVGGDEFFVFMSNFPSRELLESKASKICKDFQKTFTENNVDVNISASIGIAIYPEDGKDLPTLYKNADLALYAAKEKGKSRFEFYNGEVNSSYKSNRTQIDNQEAKRSFKDNKVEYIFKMLLESASSSDSIKSALKLISDHFGFSCAYIFEYNQTNNAYQPSFEYLADEYTLDFSSYEGKYLTITKEKMDKFYENVPKEAFSNIAESPFIHEELQEYIMDMGVKSLYVFPMIENGQIIGHFGLESRYETPPLSNEDATDLSTVCGILVTFFIKNYLYEQSKRNEFLLSEMINLSESYIYIIDRENYNILYETDSMVKLIGESSLGKLCYERYRNRTEPCEDCLLKALSEEQPKYSPEELREVYGKRIKVQAALIDWTPTQKACLINGIDISSLNLNKIKILK